MLISNRAAWMRPVIAVALAVVVTPVAAQSPTPVTVVPVDARSGAAPLQLSGSFTAKRRSMLSPAVAGQVAAVPVDVGDRVAAGDPVLRLDDTLAQLTLERLTAAQREAQATLDDARRLAREADALVGSGNVSTSVAATRRAQAQAAAAALASRQAEVAEQQEIVARHTLRAPYDGVIARRDIDAGAWAAPGTGVLELVDTRTLRLDVPVPQDRFAAIAADTPVTVRAPALGSQPRPATVETTVPVSDPAARTLLVRLLVDNTDGRLVPGMSATASFALPGAAGVVQVPRDALIRRPDGSVGVWIVEPADDGLVARVRRVDVGRTQGDAVEIRDGLAADDRVIVRGNETLTDGQAVRLVTRTGGDASRSDHE